MIKPFIIRKRLQRAVYESGYYKQDIGKEMNMTRQTFSYNLNRGTLTVPFLLKVCEIIEVEPKELFR